MKFTMVSSLLLLLASCEGGYGGASTDMTGSDSEPTVEEPTGTRYNMILRAYEVDGGRYVLTDGMGTILTDGGFTFIDGTDYAISFNDNSGAVLEVHGMGTITDVEAVDALKDEVLMDEVLEYGMGLY